MNQALMNPKPAFHFVTVGWGQTLAAELCNPIAAQGRFRFSHILHPRHTPRDLPEDERRGGIHFFRHDLRHRMPAPDRDLLASLEQEGVPTIHNMILGDRVVSALGYRDALKYATFLARRLTELLEQLAPTVVIGSFDGLHAGVTLAVAKRMSLPWFALNFSVIPAGLACFCDRMSPAARVQLNPPSVPELRSVAETLLAKFESKRAKAPSYTTPPSLSFGGQLGRVPARLRAVSRTLRKARDREFWEFTQERNDYNVIAALTHMRRVSAARKALARIQVLAAPPRMPYILFGLHMQPESSIDVWAPFFSNQMWVIELFSRVIPPSHGLLVKIHRSDAAKYSSRQLRQMRSFPGVELVQPFADARGFIERADLVVAIQGTMGLEAALLGKPVIMLGDSPVTLFPSVSEIGKITDLPQLVRRKLAESPPARSAIIDAYAAYLSPFMPASYNDWTLPRTAEEIGNYVELFRALEQHVTARSVAR